MTKRTKFRTLIGVNVTQIRKLRKTGKTIFDVAAHFGVSVKTLYNRFPGIKGSGLHKGGRPVGS